jgi:hypothetical protein
MTEHGPGLQMRLVVEAVVYDEALALDRDGLGIPEELAVSGPGARSGATDRSGAQSAIS